MSKVLHHARNPLQNCRHPHTIRGLRHVGADFSNVNLAEWFSERSGWYYRNWENLFAIAHELVLAKCPVDCVDAVGLSALTHVLSRTLIPSVADGARQLAVAEAMLARGADVNFGGPLLFMADNKAAFYWLLKHGADPNAACYRTGRLLRHVLEWRDCLDGIAVLQQLVASGCDLVEHLNDYDIAQSVSSQPQRLQPLIFATLVAGGVDINVRPGLRPGVLSADDILRNLFVYRKAKHEIARYALEMHWPTIRKKFTTACIGLQSAALPALVSLHVCDHLVDALVMHWIPVHLRYAVVVRIKHFKLN